MGTATSMPVRVSASTTLQLDTGVDLLALSATAVSSHPAAMSLVLSVLEMKSAVAVDRAGMDTAGVRRHSVAISVSSVAALVSLAQPIARAHSALRPAVASRTERAFATLTMGATTALPLARTDLPFSTPRSTCRSPALVVVHAFQDSHLRHRSVGVPRHSVALLAVSA